MKMFASSIEWLCGLNRYRYTVRDIARILVCWVGMLLSLDAMAYPIHFRHIGTKEGLPQITVRAIYQDCLGRIWFGTYEGIGIYDGSKVETSKEQSITDSLWRKTGLTGLCDRIVGNKEGDVFIKGDNRLLKYDIRHERFDQLMPAISSLVSYQGRIYAANDSIIYIYDEATGRMKSFMHTSFSDITALCFLPDSKVVIGTGHGLYLADKSGQKVHCLIQGLGVYYIFADSFGNLWASSLSQGLYRWSKDKTLFHYSDKPSAQYHLVTSMVREITEDNTGNIWFGTFLGLYRYNPFVDEFTLYQKNYLDDGMSHSSVFALYVDKQGTVWVGTYYGGANYFNPEDQTFTHYVDNPQRNDCLNHHFVGNMVEDKHGNLWICTEGGGLNKLDRKTRRFSYYTHYTPLWPQNNVKAIAYDEAHDCLYLGTHNGGLSRYDISTSTFHSYLLDVQSNKDRDQYPDYVISCLQMYKGKLYISAWNGFFEMDTATGHFRRIDNFARTFLIDHMGNAWLSEGNKLIKLALSNGKKKSYSLEEWGIHSRITHLMESRKGDIYFSTLGSGVYQYVAKGESVIHYSQNNGSLLSDYCYNVAETPLGELLVTSDKGITLFNPLNREKRFFRLGENIPMGTLADGCGIYVCKDKEIYIGGNDGLISFWEEDLSKKQKDYSMFFAELYVNNKRVNPSTSGSPLPEAFPFCRSIRLAHNQNNLIFHFASTNYIQAQRTVEYEYRLEGFDKQWIPTTSDRIYYTNLNPGKYTLHVREKKEGGGNIDQKEITMNVQILLPWWNTLWAWMLYLILIGSVIFVIVRAHNARYRLALSLAHERKEKERNEVLNQTKLRFFTSISHEFRTPLTLIISQLDAICRQQGMSPALRGKMQKLNRYSRQMRDMITELLEFRKLEQNYVSLSVSRKDMVAFLRDIYASYADYAQERGIGFEFHTDAKEMECWFEPAQMRKVCYNLLSNAFKFTKAGGKVELLLSENEREVILQVADGGVGISPEEATHIFERFYQGTNGQDQAYANPGTGIGLALTKDIVELHHGHIEVKSRIGYGTIFTVTLPKGKAVYEADGKSVVLQDEDGKESQHAVSSQEVVSLIVKDEENVGSSASDGYTLLLVEDNEELLNQLNELFSPYCQKIYTATDGEAGLSIARKEKPDLVVSDVMMPGMSGIEMCAKLKSGADTCHIPVVLLTALDSVEHSLDGLRRGADDYIGKPFDTRVLLMRCNNLVRNRQLVRNAVSQTDIPDTHVALMATSPQDKELLTRIEAIMEQHIGDTDFDATVFASELNMSRSSLFSRFKQLTGMTPNEYVQDRRLKKAAILLKEQPQLPISEVALRVGFLSPASFSRSFKAQFGLSPQQYKR